jgi:phenylacetate-CoA ligase
VWRNQWRSADELADIQLRKLRRIVDHAYHRVPFYRRRFDAVGFRPGDLRELSDLHRLPRFTRRDVQAEPTAAVLAEGIDLARCKQLVTAGSSGMPLTVYMLPEDDDVKDMVWARTALANGKRLGDRTAYLKFQSAPPRWFERLGVWRRLTLSHLDLPETRLRAMQKAPVDILRGNAFELLNIAEAALELGIDTIRPRAIFSMGSLLDDDTRVRIMQAFGCEVFDCYGATELGCIAWECREHAGLHINTDTVVVEFLDGALPAAPGQQARLVCTALDFHAMPFIRYDIGDVGVLGNAPCPCGRGFRLMRNLEGRADDFFVRADGRRVSPSVIVNRIKRTPGVVQFRLRQTTPTHIDALVIPGAEYGPAADAAMTSTLRAIMGDAIVLDIQTVDELPRDPGNKIRSTICDIGTGGA